MTLGEKDEDLENENEESFPYKEAVGGLLYISQISRSYIAFAVGQANGFRKNPRNKHWQAVKRILRYLKGTVDYKLTYSIDVNGKLTGYSDADWAYDPENRKSVTRTVYVMNGGPISWTSKRQPTIALSTVETEYIALASTCQKELWLRNLIHEINPFNAAEPIKIYSDNSGATNLSKRECVSQRSKHIDTRYHFLKENVENKAVEIEYVCTGEMTADLLTKALPKPKIECHVKALGMIGK